jgi:disulfide bond formation protein DsbB
MSRAREKLLYVAFAVSVVATLGSLYFGEVLGLPPCSLCWYQRIAMYPLVVILGVSILKGNRSVAAYVLPLSLVGLAISTYHNLLYWGVLPESARTCVAGVSCTSKYVEYFGFVTIPLMALAAFAIVSACLIAFTRIEAKTDDARS